MSTLVNYIKGIRLNKPVGFHFFLLQTLSVEANKSIKYTFNLFFCFKLDLVTQGSQLIYQIICIYILVHFLLGVSCLTLKPRMGRHECLPNRMANTRVGQVGPYSALRACQIHWCLPGRKSLLNYLTGLRKYEID